MSGDFWRVMGVQPLLGSTFGNEGDLPNSPNEAVISYGLWQRVFGGDREIVGRQVTIGGKTTTIVGVMPSTFNYPKATEVWTTTHFPLDQIKFRSDGSRFMGALARIKPDVDFQAAQNDLSLIATRLAQQYPQTDADWQFRVVPLRDSLVGKYPSRANRTDDGSRLRLVDRLCERCKSCCSRAPSHASVRLQCGRPLAPVAGD